MKKLLDSAIFFLTVLAVIALLGSYMAPYVNPNSFALPSLLGLAYHYILLANIIFLLYWVARWKKMALVVLVVLLLGYPFMASYYGINSQEPREDIYDIDIMSFNIRFLDVYNWLNIPDSKKIIINYIDNYEGDFVCMQEFPGKESVVKEFEGYSYNHFFKDVAIFSRHEIINKGIIDFDKTHLAACIFCDVEFGDDTLRIYNAHLESYRLGIEEQKIFRELMGGNSPDISNSIKAISTRLTHAIKNRAIQTDLLKNHMEKSPYPIILCGDFNDTPISYSYNTLTEGMKDSFIEKGRGIGNTYIGELPSFRIDYILHSQYFQTVSFVKDSVILSDHYPIISKLKYAVQE